MMSTLAGAARSAVSRAAGIRGNGHDVPRDLDSVLLLALRYLYFARRIVLLIAFTDIALGAAMLWFDERFARTPGWSSLVASNPLGSTVYGACLVLLGVALYACHVMRWFAALGWALAGGAGAYAVLTVFVALPVFSTVQSVPSGLIMYGILATGLHALSLQARPVG